MSHTDPVLYEAITTLRDAFVEGISEYALLRKLQQTPWLLFENADLSDSLTLFRCHFVLFNALYTLSEEWRQQGIGELDIHTLKIRLIPVTANPAAMTEHDGLKAYYLNWDNFTKTNGADVDALLDDFWLRMAGKLLPDTDIVQARCTLGFDTEGDLSRHEVKKQYRKLLQQHHPDKGGCNAKAQEISHAYRVLCGVLD